jgi:phosphoglucosamine mutase
VLAAMQERGRPLQTLLEGLALYPQVLINVKVEQKPDLEHPAISAVVRAAESEMNGSGRVLLRPSGTEPKVRVMVEGQHPSQVQSLAEKIAEVVRASC